MRRSTRTPSEETIINQKNHTPAMVKRGLIIMAFLLVMVMIAATPLMGNAAGNYFVMKLNNEINKALSECGVNPSTVFITSRAVTITNTSVILDLSLSNDYTIKVVMNLANSQLPINEVNITVLNNNLRACSSVLVPMGNVSGAYSYAIQRSNYFIELLSYSGPTPTVMNSTGSLVIYGTTINSAVIIPTTAGNIICNTGSPSIPVYIVYALDSPIMYVIQPPKPITSMLCRYSQSLSVSYLLMALLIGIATALIYEAVVAMRVGRLKITQ